MILVGLVATWTQADVDTLKAAIATGVLSVSYAGPPSRTITYQSLKEMRDLLAEMTASVTAEAGGTRYRRIRTESGFRSRRSRRGSFRYNE